MDKELSVHEIWRALLTPLLIALAAALLHRWLLALSFCFGVLAGPTFAWTEWYDPYVGPSIATEAGNDYGFHANGAIIVLLVSHMLCWLIALKRRHRRLQKG